MASTTGEIGVIITEAYDEIAIATMRVAEFVSTAEDQDQAREQLCLLAAGTIIEREVGGQTHFYHAGPGLDAALLTMDAPLLDV